MASSETIPAPVRLRRLAVGQEDSMRPADSSPSSSFGQCQLVPVAVHEHDSLDIGDGNVLAERVRKRESHAVLYQKTKRERPRPVDGIDAFAIPHIVLTVEQNPRVGIDLDHFID